MTTRSGVLFITGCNLLGRLLRSFSKPVVRVVPNPRDRTIDVTVEATTPGEYDVRLIGLDGSTLWQQHIVHTATAEQHFRYNVNMMQAGQGVYAVTATSAGEPQSFPVVWMP